MWDSNPSHTMKILTRIFGSTEAKLQLAYADLKHIEFQLRDGYEMDRNKLEKEKLKLEQRISKLQGKFSP